MTFTFICTSDKSWYLRINDLETLIEYWEYFSNYIYKAAESVKDTREFGYKMGRHANEIEMALGFHARSHNETLKDAADDMLISVKKEQYKSISSGNIVLVNKKYGWKTITNEEAETKFSAEEFIHKNTLEFPKMQSDKIEIKRFPLGDHYYIYIDGVELREPGTNKNRGLIKFYTEQEAREYAEEFIKETRRNNR